MKSAQEKQPTANPTDYPSVPRRFREVHYHRFPLGTRTNVHGACILRSILPVRLPRPHTMQQIYSHPPPGVGHRRFTLHTNTTAGDRSNNSSSESVDEQTPVASAACVAENEATVMAEIKQERERTATWIRAGKHVPRTHVVIATQTSLQYLISGFGYWNILDIGLHLGNEACVGVKAFEVSVTIGEYPGSPDTLRKGKEREAVERKKELEVEAGHVQTGLDINDDGVLPTLIVALTTHLKDSPTQTSDASPGGGRYRLYAFGAESLPPLPTHFVSKYAQPSSPSSRPDGPADSKPQKDQSPPSPWTVEGSEYSQLKTSDILSMNSYAYLEERLFSLRVTRTTRHIDLNYLPYRISQDVVPGLPPVLAVAGNDNKVHRYALGSDGIVELAPLLGPATETAHTFTSFDGRVIGQYHMQVVAQQEFALALQSTRQLSGSTQKREVLVADTEMFGAAPMATILFTPDNSLSDRTALDAEISHIAMTQSTHDAMRAGDVYDARWPIGEMGRFWSPQGKSEPRVHALIGFVGADAIVYHDVHRLGLDPTPTLVSSAGREGAVGGVYILPDSSEYGMLTSLHIDDLDFDGVKEIVLGTVSGNILVYKLVDGPRARYVLVWRRRVPAPAYATFSIDINCDGVNELVIVTLLGVHILQPNLALAKRKLMAQLKLAKGE